MRRGRSGSMAIELAMWLPFMFLLIGGIVQFGKITYIYYSLQKYDDRRGQLSGGAERSQLLPGRKRPRDRRGHTVRHHRDHRRQRRATITGLSADMITVTTQCLDPVTLTLGDCSVAGCDTPVGAQRPDFITVSMPGGYIVQPRIPYILVDPIPLKPQAVMAYGGGS